MAHSYRVDAPFCSHARGSRIRPLQALALLVVALASATGAEVALPWVATNKLDAELKGQILIEEMNCAACHTGDAALAQRAKKAPRLANVGSRVNPTYIESFIRDPHGTKPGTTMPDALSSLAEDEKKSAANAITHFLLSLKKNEFALQAPDAVAAQQGKILFHSRGCAQCHSPRDERGTELSPANSVPLGALDKKYSFKSLVAFLRNPHEVRPSGRMPDLRLQGQDLDRIAHFLLQDTRVPGSLAYTLYRGRVYEGLKSDQVNAERAGHVKDFTLASLGVIQQHTAITYDGWLNVTTPGKYRFFLTLNGGSLTIDGAPIITLDPSDRRGVKEVEAEADLMAGWRRIQLTYFHTGPKASFSCEMTGPGFERQAIPSAMLSVSKEPIPVLEQPTVEPDLAARGRMLFEKFGCANCHTDVQVPTKPSVAFSALTTNRGCLSETAGQWPRFQITAEQRTLITTALPRAAQPQLDEKQQLAKTLVTFNCLACHERAGLGGIAQERNALFTGTQVVLGDQGRLPPPLTTVGAKLTPGWMKDVLLNGNRQRGYLDASMPQFGEANVGHLVELFAKVDSLEVATIPPVADPQEFRTAGHEMMGTNGFSCIACHEFNGQRSGEIAAVDLAHVTQRLSHNWFHLYMRQPTRFHPTVIMPSYWPGGQSSRPNILGGDSAKQIEALWVYLADGSKAKKPIGLSRQTNVLQVGDVAEMCRGRSSIGYRGIAVGYPERISLSFNSEEMSLRQLWKGEFANIDFGSFNPRGTDQISFAAGIPFHRLASLEDSWPYKGKTNYLFPQDHGYQFRGTRLDELRRPTFLFSYGDIAVEDGFIDVRGPGDKPFFKRTLVFETTTAQALFYFRAATGTTISAQSERAFTLDQLQLRITSDHQGTVRPGSPGDVLIPLTLPTGRSTLTLEYQW